MKCTLISLFALALLAGSSANGTAEELTGTVKVSGRDIEVQVCRQDGSPAAGVQVRLLYGRQLAVAVARTDEKGSWIHRVNQTGAYDALVESESDAEPPLRLPFTVLDAAEPATDLDRSVWITVAPALVCVAGAVMVFVIVLTRASRKGTRLRWGHVLTIAALLTAGGGLFEWSTWREWRKLAEPVIFSEPDVAAAARDYLRERDVKPLSGPLERMLAESPAELVPTQAHPLLGRPAPDFELADYHNQSWRLRDRLKRGPVVLVFYYGYHCNHCVGQLFALHDDIDKFRELGAEVLGVSADPPELTQQRFRQYGEFAYPVLTDPGNKVAEAYGVYRPPSAKKPEELQHGTFVIGRDGRVHWAQHGGEPFTGNLTLLHELARLEGRLPAREMTKDE
jgi:peroxiredoxin